MKTKNFIYSLSYKDREKLEIYIIILNFLLTLLFPLMLILSLFLRRNVIFLCEEIIFYSVAYIYKIKKGKKK